MFCSSVLEDPVTLICGHSTCKRCLLRDLTTVCRKCKVKYEPIEEDPIDVEPYVKVYDWGLLSTFILKIILCLQIDILVCELVKKFWFKDLEATKLRNAGNRLFQRGAVQESISKYTEAIELGQY